MSDRITAVEAYQNAIVKGEDVARAGMPRMGVARAWDEGHLAAQVTGDLFGEVDERGAQRAGQGRDHLAGGFLAAALDLGEVLRRDPGPGRRLGQRLLLLLAQEPEPPAEYFPPEGLLGPWFRLRFRMGLPLGFATGFAPQRIHVRVLGHTSA